MKKELLLNPGQKKLVDIKTLSLKGKLTAVTNITS